MPYINKRNRFVTTAKHYAEVHNRPIDCFTKADLLAIAKSINMKGIPTWVLKEHRSAVSKGVYDLTSLINAVPV